MRFFKNYKLFSLAIVAGIVGLILQFTGMHTAADWVLGIVALYTVIPIVWGMWQDLQTGRYGIDILAVTAIVASILLRQYWAGIVIVVMFTGGGALEDYAEHRAKTELDALLSRVPQQATVIRKNKTLTIPVRDIRVQDDILLKAGEVVPADAVIIEGDATFDESSLTGESLPQAKAPGDSLLSGSINLDGAITARCIRIAADSQYEQIIALVRAASTSQAPVVRLADRYSIPFTITSYVIALGAWFFSHQAIRFLEVIVVATPCPLLLAAPIAIISGMSRAAKHGIIIKTGSALERLAKAKTIAFDKTGTLTQGTLRVDTVTAYAPFTKQQVLGFAASVELNSNHVVGQAIVDKARHAKASLGKAKQVKETAGQGLLATLSGKQVTVGRLTFLESRGVHLPTAFLKKEQTQTAVYVAIGDSLAGYLTLVDTVRKESKATIKELTSLGMENILMVTGDATATAKNIAKQLGIRMSDVHAEMLPADKLRVIEELPDRPVVFVGDGVNDAPVLTASDVGIALGARGSTAASESADMVIMLDDVSRVARAVKIAHHTFRIARQSIIGGIALSIVLMGIFATGHFPPLTGAILQEVVDVIVIINALRAHGSWGRVQAAVTPITSVQ
jgi:heavy metal translocating P-type ATPase